MKMELSNLLDVKVSPDNTHLSTIYFEASSPRQGSNLTSFPPGRLGPHGKSSSTSQVLLWRILKRVRAPFHNGCCAIHFLGGTVEPDAQTLHSRNVANCAVGGWLCFAAVLTPGEREKSQRVAHHTRSFKGIISCSGTLLPLRDLTWSKVLRGSACDTEGCAIIRLSLPSLAILVSPLLLTTINRVLEVQCEQCRLTSHRGTTRG